MLHIPVFIWVSSFFMSALIYVFMYICESHICLCLLLCTIVWNRPSCMWRFSAFDKADDDQNHNSRCRHDTDETSTFVQTQRSKADSWRRGGKHDVGSFCLQPRSLIPGLCCLEVIFWFLLSMYLTTRSPAPQISSVSIPVCSWSVVGTLLLTWIKLPRLTDCTVLPTLDAWIHAF